MSPDRQHPDEGVDEAGAGKDGFIGNHKFRRSLVSLRKAKIALTEPFFTGGQHS